jgi:hypothetical protein
MEAYTRGLVRLEVVFTIDRYANRLDCPMHDQCCDFSMASGIIWSLSNKYNGQVDYHQIVSMLCGVLSIYISSNADP